MKISILKNDVNSSSRFPIRSIATGLRKSCNGVPEIRTLHSNGNQWRASLLTACLILFQLFCQKDALANGEPANAAQLLLTAHAIATPSPSITITILPGGALPDTPTGYVIHKRKQGDSVWTGPINLAGNASTYVDSAVQEGFAYEYEVVRNFSASSVTNTIVVGMNENPVHSRGKMILLVDNTFTTSLASELAILQADLTGDGWTVLRHDVPRGPTAPYEEVDPTTVVGNPNSPYQQWADQNKVLIKQTRAIIKADYDADPANVKSVFLFGHVPVPYAGHNTVGSHDNLTGTMGADVFYGEMSGVIGTGGWTDTANTMGEFYPNPGKPFPSPTQIVNVPGDGKYDNVHPPFPQVLEVGRVDLYWMPSFEGASAGNHPIYISPGVLPPMSQTELDLLRQYLKKDHDFRVKNFNVARRAFMFTGTDPRTGGPMSFDVTGNWMPFTAMFGPNPANGPVQDEVVRDVSSTSFAHQVKWFPVLKDADYMFAFATGFGSPPNCSGVGSTFPSAANCGADYYDDCENNFIQIKSKAVFTAIFGSAFGNWDVPDNLLRAVLANDGYGLTAYYNPASFAPAGLQSMALGETIGHATLVDQNTDSGANVNDCLLGDPSLRMHIVAPPSNLNINRTDASSSVSLVWNRSLDDSCLGSQAFIGYNVYRAATPNGPFELINNTPIAAAQTSDKTVSYVAPANNATAYMVRAVVLQDTPSGTYFNMSEGVSERFPLVVSPVILANPASRIVTPGTTVAFSIAASGTGPFTYQWSKDGAPVSGATSEYLLIDDAQNANAGSYTVAVSNSGGSATSSAATLALNETPVAVADNYPITRNVPADLNVLVNDRNDPDINSPNTGLTIASVSDLSNPNAGTLTISGDRRSIHFAPAQSYLGTVTFTYLVTDGTSFDQATVTLTVNPTPGNNPPTVSSFNDQSVIEDTVVDIPFTVSDDFTLPDNLVFTTSSSDSSVIPSENIMVTGSGANRTLHIIPGLHQVGSSTITLSVKDEDSINGSGETTRTFVVTVQAVSTPTMLVTDTPTTAAAPDFHFQVNGPAGSEVEILVSDDLHTWQSLGKHTLSGNIYNFTDNSIGSRMHRFYRAENNNGCSGNVVGFIKVVVPGRKPDNTGGYAYFVNQLNNPAGNSLSSVIPQAPPDTACLPWNLANHSFPAGATFLGIPGQLWDSEYLLDPGNAFQIQNSTQTPFTITFIGDVPALSQQSGNSLPSSAGVYDWIGSAAPRAGGLVSLQFPAVDGDAIYKWDKDAQDWSSISSYIGTPADIWDVEPSVDFGEAFLLFSGGNHTQGWVSDVSPCPPTTALTVPLDGTVYVAPVSITLTATASSSAGVSQVKFLQGGNTEIGIGTGTGSTYSYNWNNVAAGTYSITVQVTGSDGLITVSQPVTITVDPKPTLGAGSFSGNDFQFTITGGNGAQVEVKATADLSTWTSFGTVTLSGGSYNFTDTGAGSSGHRFYVVKENGIASADTFGFIKVVVPGKTGSSDVSVLVANQLNNPAGNNLDTIMANVPDGTVVHKYDVPTQAYVDSVFAGAPDNFWSPTMSLDPGEALFVVNQTTTPFTLTFIGSVPTSQVNNGIPASAGKQALMSSIMPVAGTLPSLGFPSVDGDAVYHWDVSSQQWSSISSYFGPPDDFWDVVPTVDIGEGFLLITGGAHSQPSWAESVTVTP